MPMITSKSFYQAVDCLFRSFDYLQEASSIEYQQSGDAVEGVHPPRFAKDIEQVVVRQVECRTASVREAFHGLATIVAV
jgi:hypothetical protein